MSTLPQEPTSQQPEQETLSQRPLFLAGFALVTIAILIMAIFLSICTLVTIESPTPVPTTLHATPSMVPSSTPQPLIQSC